MNARIRRVNHSAYGETVPWLNNEQPCELYFESTEETFALVSYEMAWTVAALLNGRQDPAVMELAALKRAMPLSMRRLVDSNLRLRRLTHVYKEKLKQGEKK